MLLIGDDNSEDNDVAVGLVVGLYCGAGAGPIQFSGDTVLVMRPYFRAGSGSIPTTRIRLTSTEIGSHDQNCIPRTR